MPHRTRPLTALLLFLGVNVALVSTITPVYDFVCFHPYWERRVGCGISKKYEWSCTAGDTSSGHPRLYRAPVTISSHRSHVDVGAKSENLKSPCDLPSIMLRYGNVHREWRRKEREAAVEKNVDAG